MRAVTELDVAILLWIQNHIRCEALSPFVKAITHLGDLGLIWILLGLALLIGKKTRPVGYAALLSLCLGALFNNILLKNMVARPRPYDVSPLIHPLVARPKDFSFPSGHTCASFASAFVYYRMCPKRYGVPLMVLACGIGLSRLYVGVHYLSDVVAGGLVGFLASVLALKSIEKGKTPSFIEK